MKDEHEQTANSLFLNTGIKITTHGKRHLGADIGSSAFAEEYVRVKVVEWMEEVENLAIIFVSQPQAFVHGSRTNRPTCSEPFHSVVHAFSLWRINTRHPNR